MKIFIATLGTETNTFSPIVTGRGAFMGAREWHRTGGSLATATPATLPLRTWREMAAAGGHEVVESICSFAQPGGRTPASVHEELRDLVVGDLKAALPVDIVLLSMHGAMVAVGYDDCEGDVLAHVRAAAGPEAVVGTVLDLHCHLTEPMREQADLIVTYKEYPHDDIRERSAELYWLAVRTAAGAIRPVMAYHDCRMLGIWRTPHGPVRAFVDRMTALEGKDGILSVSFVHGFPWADVPDVGAKMLVIADGDADRAAALARTLGREIWAMRAASVPSGLTMDAARARIAARAASRPARPLVIADVSDNAGGGAPSDNTIILRDLLAHGVTNVALGCIWDPAAVAFCTEAGEGATFPLRLGGKCGPASGDPIDVTAHVRRCSDNLVQTGLSGGAAYMGRSAWIAVDGIDIVVTARRQQVFSPDVFGNMGITLADKDAVVVKSAQHFYNAFAAIADDVVFVPVAGCVVPDMTALRLPRARAPLWPHVADPFAGTG
ncbi:M81 family metallopeptidase [Nguyenibacter vanlangensis]|uniref:Microcystinase C n=1 Tax=Nguyenibacter vanlangensis TaxID=1216886 RepID=A0ABZ3D3G3_9PROT